MITLLWIVVFGLPTTVLFAAILWPQRIPEDRTVDAIRRRVEREDRRRYRHGWDEY
ncbi:hypothetical protein [Nocardia neocaledoniensis]|uniref:hypothetical protein n=1 Tax=Nocardia neocaledoniensis TaxID=236511 RepID=UPI00245468E0|nr:hypothetical protein [Nocardia neocaledoniensis]